MRYGVRLLFFITLILQGAAFADTNGSATLVPKHDSLWEKVAIAVVSSVLSLFTGYILLQIKQRAEPQKRISYHQEIKNGLIDVEPSIREKVVIRYNDEIISSITNVTFTLLNSGNTVIKDEYVRFEFPMDAQVLEAFFDPIPERELNARAVEKSDLSANERQYTIGHLEKGYSVRIRFIIAGGPSGVQVKIHPFNESGDVEFVPRVLTESFDDQRHMFAFVSRLILFFVGPSITDFLPIPLFSEVASGVIRTAIALTLLPHVIPASRLISKALMRLLIAEHPATISIQEIRASGSVYVAGGQSRLISNESNRSGLSDFASQLETSPPLSEGPRI